MVWKLACPSCRVALALVDDEEGRCPTCAASYRREEGIWRLLAGGRREALQTFVEQYEHVRRAEGRGTEDPSQLRALPYRTPSRREAHEWYVRAKSYDLFVRRVLDRVERARGRPLWIGDLGSGLGWLAYRLARRGHQVLAVDLSTSVHDGLGAHHHYDAPFLSVQAEFSRLPLGEPALDLAIYNAAIHYAGDYVSTLREALRVLLPGGRVALLDSPLYRDGTSGAAMVREREAEFQRRYGFRGDAVPTEGFLTYRRLEELGRDLALRWELFSPWHGVRRMVAPWMARVRGRREPARFKVIVGQRLGERE